MQKTLNDKQKIESANYFKSILLKLELSNSDLAREIKVSRGYVSHILHSRSAISEKIASRLIDMAKLKNINVDLCKLRPDLRDLNA